MLHSHTLLPRFPTLPYHRHSSPSPPVHPLLRPFPTSLPPLRAVTVPHTSLAAEPPSPSLDSQPSTDAEAEGPIELPPSSPTTIFAVDDNPSSLQVATSVLLTGAISVFLFRSLRRRARKAKELRVRSSGVKNTKDIKEEALDSLKAMGVASVEVGGPPSPIQAMLGGIAAGVIALILYRFTTTIEASLNRQTISDNFSVRQITITIRTIINGICYLATFVFGINSIGLLLYSVQLAINSLMESPDTNSKSSKNDEDQSEMANDATISSTRNSESTSSETKEGSGDS